MEPVLAVSDILWYKLLRAGMRVKRQLKYVQ